MSYTSISDGREGKCYDANVGCNRGNKVYSAWIVENEDDGVYSYSVCFRKSINKGQAWDDLKVLFNSHHIKNLNMLNDNSGRIYISFVISNINYPESGLLYFIYSLSDGDTWSEANIIDYDVNYRKMVITNEGTVHFLYQHSDLEYWGYSKRYVRDEEEPDVVADFPRRYYTDFADICCYEREVYIVSYKNAEGGKYSMWIQKSEDGGNTWEQSQNITNSRAEDSDKWISRCSDLQVECSESGNVYIKYLEHLTDTETDTNLDNMLYIRNSDNNAATWESPVLVCLGEQLSLPKIEVTDDFVYVFWFEGDKLMLSPYLRWNDTLENVTRRIALDENIVRASLSNIDSSENDRYYCLYYKETRLEKTSLRVICPYLMHSGTAIGTRVGEYQLSQDFSYGAVSVKANSNGNIYALFPRNNNGDSEGEMLFRHMSYRESPSNLPDIGDEAERMKNIALDKVKKLYELLNDEQSYLEELGDKLVGEIDLDSIGDGETINSNPEQEDDSAIYSDDIPTDVMGTSTAVNPDQDDDDNNSAPPVTNLHVRPIVNKSANNEETENDISRGTTEHTDFEVVPIDGQNNGPGYINITPSITGIENNTVGFDRDTGSEGGAVFGGILGNTSLKAVTINNTPADEENSGGALFGCGPKKINISSVTGKKITEDGESVGIPVPDVEPNARQK